jgi:50S ribosomal protein L16 3-hydroxylase
MRSEQRLDILGGLTARQFLGGYWQKKPLLIRQAWLPAVALVDADELAGLACEEEIESRIIRGSGSDGEWQLEHGPFDEKRFAELGDSNWTLLVQAVDHYLEAVARLKQHFRFLPDWRLDDIMVSFAAPGGSVGPHIDQYDVFLLQTEGRRRWQIGEVPSAMPALLPHPELQLLQDFSATDSYVLEAGDMLYLPPGVPHWGVAVDPCITCSIGFRAPSHEEIISHYCDDVLAGLRAGRFSDPEREPSPNPGLIDGETLVQLRNIVSQLRDEGRLADWFGRYMTAPKYGIDNDPVSDPDADSPATSLQPCGDLFVSPASRLAYCEIGGHVTLFANGVRYSGRGNSWEAFVKRICKQHRLEYGTHGAWYRDPSIRPVLSALMQRGVLEA